MNHSIEWYTRFLNFLKLIKILLKFVAIAENNTSEVNGLKLRKV